MPLIRKYSNLDKFLYLSLDQQQHKKRGVSEKPNE